MKELVFLLEEESARAMLEGLLPRIAPGIAVRYMVFEGRQDLEKRLVVKMRAYLKPACFIVLRDQDSNPDCLAIKTKLMQLCAETGHTGTLVRIACRELESFYLADLKAVEQGLVLKGLSNQQEDQKYRNPDYLGSPSTELKKLTKARYQKVSGSRAIGVWLDLENNRSNSFRHLVLGIRRLVQAIQANRSS